MHGKSPQTLNETIDLISVNFFNKLIIPSPERIRSLKFGIDEREWICDYVPGRETFPRH